MIKSGAIRKLDQIECWPSILEQRPLGIKGHSAKKTALHSKMFILPFCVTNSLQFSMEMGQGMNIVIQTAELSAILP